MTTWFLCCFWPWRHSHLSHTCLFLAITQAARSFSTNFCCTDMFQTNASYWKHVSILSTDSHSYAYCTHAYPAVISMKTVCSASGTIQWYFWFSIHWFENQLPVNNSKWINVICWYTLYAHDYVYITLCTIFHSLLFKIGKWKVTGLITKLTWWLTRMFFVFPKYYFVFEVTRVYWLQQHAWYFIYWFRLSYTFSSFFFLTFFITLPFQFRVFSMCI